MNPKRCINIDWLEVYCLEDYIGYPHNADYFRKVGFNVDERAYGTPVYHEMFYVLGNDEQPLLEVRRAPKSAIGRQINGVLDPMACHIRLSNRTCYFNEPVQLLQNFLERYGFHFQRISRLDICLDFIKFDYGDDPADFIDRYMRGVYLKINQANISAHGKDRWDVRIWNSISWGNLKSMIGTKFYCKTLELKQAHDKPYIRQAWRAAGLVDDEFTLVAHDAKGTAYYPDIWRVEFSIRSSTRRWFIIEDESGKKTKKRSIRHTLDMYKNRQQLLDMFLSLADHYFHFKIYQEGVRKDRCPDKKLFKTKDRAIFYKLENIATKAEPSRALATLKARLERYASCSVNRDVSAACYTLIEDIEFKQRTASMPMPWNADELTALRLLIAKRIKAHDKPLSEDMQIIESMLNVERDLYGELADE